MCRLCELYPVLIVIYSVISSVDSALRTGQGIIYGRQTDNSIEYLGIPYARVIRWKPPIDLASETFPNGSFNGTTFGPCCPQPSYPIYIPTQDEQCLNLNIFQPIVPSNHSLLPVFVWIHGGGHQIGCAAQAIPALFNGTNMITHSPPDQPVIIISINYRLGPLADLFLKELAEEDSQWPTAGNYMYLDMLSALKWIKRNIKDYGGDPTNVSLFGQSAGGLSVTDLGAVRGSADLYLAAISESGLSSPGTYSSYYNMNDALDHSNSMVKQLNCTNEDKEELLSCMRNSSFDNLLLAYGNRYTRPIIDDYFFPYYPPLAIQNGKYNNISLIMGNNDFEKPICSFEPEMNFTQSIATIGETIAQKWIPFIVDYYQLKDCSTDRTANVSRCCEITRQILTDQIFDCDIRRILNAFYTKYGPEYANNRFYSYHLNCYPQCPKVDQENVCRHTSELPFVFGTISDVGSMTSVNCTWNNQTRAFSNGIIAQWITVASTGRPMNDWPSYDPTAPRHFHITPDQGFLSEVWTRNCSLFDQIEADGSRIKFQNNHHL